MKYYILSFMNEISGTIKEEYIYELPENIENIAKELKDKMLNKEHIKISIYKLEKNI